MPPHRTKLNGKRIEPHVKLPLPPGSQVTFGASTRLYVVVEDVPPPVHDFTKGSGWDSGAVRKDERRDERRGDRRDEGARRRSRSRSRDRDRGERVHRDEDERGRGGGRDDYRHRDDSRRRDDRRYEDSRRRSRSPPRAYRR